MDRHFDNLYHTQDTIAEERGASRGCLFCKTGQEKAVARQFGLLYPSGRAIAPVKARQRRAGGRLTLEYVPLLPGYVFFEAFGEPPFRQLMRFDGVLKLLTYSDRDWRLQGHDDEFARMLLAEEGVIGLSTACYDKGNRIHILDGFMKGCEGSIIRVNRRAQTAEIQISFQEKKITMWLGFELIERVDRI